MPCESSSTISGRVAASPAGGVAAGADLEARAGVMGSEYTAVSPVLCLLKARAAQSERVPRPTVVRMPDSAAEPRVVHVVCATVKPDAPAEAVSNALKLARAMYAAPGARRVLCGADAGLVVTATWLDGRAALEPFAASPPHMSFVMRGLAPCIQGMWSAGVETDAAPPDDAAALWVFGLRDAETLYEWQVRDLVQAIETLPGSAAAGPTFEERDRYRVGGVVALRAEEIEAFRAALEATRPSWGDLAALIVEGAVRLDQESV